MRDTYENVTFVAKQHRQDDRCGQSDEEYDDNDVSGVAVMAFKGRVEEGAKSSGMDMEWLCGVAATHMQKCREALQGRMRSTHAIRKRCPRPANDITN